MGQTFYFDEEDLIGQFKRLNDTRLNMLEFAWLHEDIIAVIESLMSRWAVNTLSTQRLKDEWDQLDKDLRESYFDFDDYLGNDWWLYEIEYVDDEIKKKMIERFRLTIGVCIFSNTYDEESLWDSIEKAA